jgi:hypothetical protein
MRSPVRPVAAALAVALVALAGCQPKLDYSRKIDVEPGEVQSVILDPIARKQKVKVRITSLGSQVTVALVGGPEANAAKSKMLDGGEPANNLGFKKGFENGELLAVVPANTELHVLVTSSKKSTVEVKITN